MGVLEENVKILLNQMKLTQWKKPQVDPTLFDLPILNREGLCEKKMDKGFYTTKTSGSTGIPVTVEKTKEDYMKLIQIETLLENGDYRSRLSMRLDIGRRRNSNTIHSQWD
jgi:hypothetical protein